MGETDSLKEQIKTMSEKISILESFLIKSQKNIIKEVLQEFSEQQKKDSLKTEILRKLRKNKKKIIQQKIIETLKAKPILLSDLKYYIVDQLNYCSKASFYRYFEELKSNLEITQGIVYLAKDIIV